MPCSNSGFVYLLVSTPAPERVYVGTTKNLAVRLTQHNRGYGSEGTGANPEFLPWAVVSYMTNMAWLSRSERMGLELQWQVLNARSVEHSMNGIEQYIENGRQVMSVHNSQNKDQLDRRINYVILAQRRYAPELADIEEFEPRTSDNDMETDLSKNESPPPEQVAEKSEIFSYAPKHTVRVHNFLKRNMQSGELSFDKISSSGCSRKTAAGVFFQLLQLNDSGFVALKQDEAYGDIKIAPSHRFDEQLEVEESIFRAPHFERIEREAHFPPFSSHGDGDDGPIID